MKKPGKPRKPRRKPRVKKPPSHVFCDPGPPIEASDWEPRILGNPEEAMAKACLKAGRDFGGPIRDALEDLHTVLQSAE